MQNSNKSYEMWVNPGKLIRETKEKLKKRIIERLIKKHGKEHKFRITEGVSQILEHWQPEDGTPEEVLKFCDKYFVSDPIKLNLILNRFEKILEQIYGSVNEMSRSVTEALEIEDGPIMDIDYLFGELCSFRNLDEEFFRVKIAFVALLNFTAYTYEDMAKESPKWTREQWAMTRLAETFNDRVPSELQQEAACAQRKTSLYIDNYNIYMGNIRDAHGRRAFTDVSALQSHWGLRDYLQALYREKKALNRQKTIFRMMEKIINQEIPAIIINNPETIWNPYKNTVFSAKTGKKLSAAPELNTRYKHLLNKFRAVEKTDRFYETTVLRRDFEDCREIALVRVKKLMLDILQSKPRKLVAKLIEERLGRPLEPFDIWYEGFKQFNGFEEKKLDKITLKLYPNAKAFQDDIPRLLEKLGFNPEIARLIASRIIVCPSRGSGEAYPALKRSDKPRLLTRFTKKGLKYQGFRTAIHELGHCVEMVLSLNGADRYLLAGDPCEAFSEAFAFIFENRNLELLGLPQENPLKQELCVLDLFWNCYYMSAVGLLDISIWQWMYKNKNNLTAEKLKNAVVDIANGIWNKYFAPIFGVKNVPIFAIYSHLIERMLYTPDYPLGYIIRYQIEAATKNKNLAVEMERMCRIGNISPELWMKKAVGKHISAAPLIRAAARATRTLKK